MFQTPYKRLKIVSAETFKGVKSITQPEQVLPLNRIITGLKNGTIFLPNNNQEFDIPENMIDVPAGKTPESTNAAVHDATIAALDKSAADAGVVITAAPGFVPEDAHALTDAVEAAISQAAIETGATGGSADSGADAQQGGDTGSIAAYAGKSSSSSVENAVSEA